MQSNKNKIINTICALLFAQSFLYAGDFMREAGKIRVVIGVLVIIFCGLFAFLWYLERRINKLEKRIDHE